MIVIMKKLIEKIHDYGAIAKQSIDFTFQSVLYVMTGNGIAIFILAPAESRLEVLPQLLEVSTTLTPMMFIMFVVVLGAFIAPFIPNMIQGKSSKVLWFLVIALTITWLIWSALL